jgi:phosphoglycolate phosphatase-like HAD superfamily hydrolase
MLLKATEELGLDLGACAMVGDSSDDIEAGHNAGVRTVLLSTGKGRVREGVAPADRVYPTLLDAAHDIIGGQL